ncbi:hypothetical protein GY45DRAFT_684546 [Cubamyces sp. BRFM 1775]|nr:hypothetical protein GY45DRAFT_684546 [Cubamyces sp. BRFM 1775]
MRMRRARTCHGEGLQIFRSLWGGSTVPGASPALHHLVNADGQSMLTSHILPPFFPTPWTPACAPLMTLYHNLFSCDSSPIALCDVMSHLRTSECRLAPPPDVTIHRDNMALNSSDHAIHHRRLHNECLPISILCPPIRSTGRGIRNRHCQRAGEPFLLTLPNRRPASSPQAPSSTASRSFSLAVSPAHCLPEECRARG